MDGVTVRVAGLDRAVKALSKAGADAGEMRDLMHKVGEIVASAARPLTRHKSGRMAGSIRAGRGKTKAVVRMGGAAVPYAGVEHYGWPAHNISPRPSLVEALDATQTQAFAALVDGISDILRKDDLI